MPRQYNFGAEHKAKLAARKAVKEKEREIEKLRKKLENKTRSFYCDYPISLLIFSNYILYVSDWILCTVY